ncbi:MAG: hypothetical protein ACR2KG_05290 [Nocardioidaceae bacterium]
MSSLQPPPSRRSILQLGAISGAAWGVTALTGCTVTFSHVPVQPIPSGGQPAAAHDIDLLTTAIADEEALLNYCGAAIRQQRGLRDLLVPIQLRQRSHVTGLRKALRGSPPKRSTAMVEIPAHPATVVDVLTQLVSARRLRRFTDCMSAQTGLLARLFASVAASHAVTVESIQGRP